MAHRSGHDGTGNLKIGDTVLLFYNADKRLSAESGEKSGYILADLSGSGTRQLLTVQPLEREDQQLPSIRFGTFKVLASNKYEAQTRYRTLAEKLKESRRKNVSQKGALDLLQLQASQAKRDSKVEQAENAANQKRLEGTSINYGDSIQLLHTLTGKYVCVSSKETSITEDSKLKVYLQRKDSVGCIFRLHPHIKVQTVGEEVNYDDQIKFESVATEGQFLHCSKRTFGEVNVNINSNCYELNVAAKESSLKIIRHYQATGHGAMQSDRALRASGIVRFFHRKHHCYVVAKGSFAGRYACLPEIDDWGNSIDGQPSTLSSLESTLRRASSKSSHVTAADVEPTSVTDSLSPPDLSSSLNLQEHFGTLRRRSTSNSQKVRETEFRFGSLNDKVVSEDVHFKSRRELAGISSPPSTSPNTFWEIESFQDPCSGEPMKWSEHCKIKHLSTRKYLAITEDSSGYKVTLKSQKLDASSTVFELYPVVQQIGEEIGQESYVRVKHIATGTWLHLNKDLHYHPTGDGDLTADHDLDEEEGSRQLYQIVATKEINSDDAFILQKVEEKLVADFNYVAGITEVLTNQLKQCESLMGDKPHSTEVCHMKPALSSLDYLKSLLSKTEETTSRKVKQKLLRGLKILELVVRLLNLHKDEKSNDREVCTACFEIITAFLEGNSRRNKIYISRMISHIFTSSVWDTELSGGQTVENVLTGITRNNPTLLYEEEFIKSVSWHLVKKLTITEKDSKRVIQLLEGLSVLCTCKGDPIKQNQIIIMKQLQKEFGGGGGQGNMLLYPLRIRPEGHTDESEVDIQVQVEFESEIGYADNVNLELEETDYLDPENNYFDVVQFQAMVSKHFGKKMIRSGFWYDLKHGDEAFFQFFMAQLRLLIMMCKGNVRVIRTLRGSAGVKSFGVELTFPIIMCAINDAHIKQSHSNLRTMLVELLWVMYVEVGGNQPFLEKFPFSFKVDEVGKIPFESSTRGNKEKAEITALTGVENYYFPALRQWIKNFFQDPSEYFFAVDENDKNGVVVQVLQLLAALVKYGYYDDASDVNDLLPSLYKLLDGKNDFPTKKIKQAMMSDDGEEISQPYARSFYGSRNRRSRRGTQRSVTNKRKSYHRQDSGDLDDPPDIDDWDPESILKALAEFREKGGRYGYQGRYHNHFAIKHWAMEVLNLFFNFQLYKNLHNFIYEFRWIALPKEGREEKTKTDDFEMEIVGSPETIEHFLSQLMEMNPRDPQFMKDSPKRAQRLFEGVINHLSNTTQRRGDPDLTNDDQLPDMLLDLANYEYDSLMQYSLLLLDRHYTTISNMFEIAQKTHLLKSPDSVQFFNKIEALLLKLTAFLRAGSSLELDGLERSPIEILTGYCWLEGEVEEIEPHQINQNILLSFGILQDVLKYVTQQSYSASSVEHECKKIVDCLVFLKALACKNQIVQQSLLQYVDVFLNVVMKTNELGLYIGGLLQEIFSGGPSIALSVSEDQIGKIMKIIFGRGKENSSRTNAALMESLEELLMVKELNLPLKHTQLIVAKNFSLMREDDRYWCKDLLSEGKRKFRWELLTAEDDSNHQLSNLLMITNLLATCAYGYDAGADSICYTIYTEDELIKIISSQKIKLYRKRPFLKFLVWVYMNVDGGNVEERGHFFWTNKDLWDHMREMAAVLRGTARIIRDMPHPSYLSVKELIVNPSWKYLHECPGRKHRQAPSLVVLKDYPNHEEFNISDVLLYISDGFLPFLQVFYGEFYKKTHHHEQHILEGGTTDEIYKAMLGLYHPLTSTKRVYFTSEVQVKQFYRALLVLKPYSVCQLSDEMFKVEDFIENHPEVFHRELASSAREIYNANYAEEIELNAKFRKFVTNYKAAYEGENTRRAQIINARNKRIKSDTEPYSEFLDEDETRPGPRFLPLGHSFQEHVALFQTHRGLGILGSTHRSVVRNSKERLLKQLEISFSKMRQRINSESEIDMERQTQLDIKCLQILRAIIYNEMIQIDVEEKERAPKKYRKQCELHLHPIQNEIQDLGNAVLRVMPLLSHPNNAITREALAFLEVLFEFGNSHLQEASKDLLNLHENHIFLIMQEAMREAMLVYRESQLLTSLLKTRMALDKKIIEKEQNGTVEAKQDPDGKITSLHKGTPKRKIFRRQETTQILFAGDQRVPFLAIYKHSDADLSLDEKTKSILKFSELSGVSMIIKVLGLICDGQNRRMQDFLREQNKGFQNVNMIGEITAVLYEITEKRRLSFDMLPLFIQILESLMEICAGNFKNHDVIFNKHILSIINFVLQIDISGIKPPKRVGRRVSTTVIMNYSDLNDITSNTEDATLDFIQLRVMGLKLKVSAIDLLDVMMEDISVKSKKLTQQIAEGLDITGLHWSMVDLFALKDDKALILRKFDDNASRALFKAYKILMHLADAGIGSPESLKPTERNGLRAWQFCEKKSQIIEIVYKDQENKEEVLTKIRFEPNLKTEIKEHLRDTVKYQVDRSTHSEKLRDFHEWIKAVKKDTLYYNWLKINKLHFITLLGQPRYWFLLLLTLVLNILVIVGYSDPNNMEEGRVQVIRNLDENSTITNPNVKKPLAIAIYVLGGLHLLLAIWMVMEYFIVTWPHFVLPEFLYRIRFKHFDLSAFLIRIWILPKFNRTYSSVNIFGVTPIYSLIFLVSSVLALVYLGYFYCLCLLYITINNDILQRALQSITKNWKSLFWVALLLLTVLFIYAVIAFAFYRQEFMDADNVFCASLHECFASVLRFGLIDSFLEIDVGNGVRNLTGRFFFDIIFFIIVTTIGLNIVFGIIVDTFSELRDARFHAEQDMKSSCFICNLPSHEFDKLSNLGFISHVKSDHNMWAYIYYSIYLDQVDISDHNAIEKYVYEKLNSGDISYLPFNQALVLEGVEDESEELRREVKELRYIMKDRFMDLNLRFDAIEKFMKAKDE